MQSFNKLFLLLCLVIAGTAAHAQELKWNTAGDAFYQGQNGAVYSVSATNGQQTELVSAGALTPAGAAKPLSTRHFTFTPDEKGLLLFTNTKRVWRYETRGDYWYYNLPGKKLRQLGKGLPESSLMFAKISPDGAKAAYVSKHNLYVEDLATGKIDQLTKDGTRKLINGTFDWAYEEEFGCRDGFRWSPDSKSIAYWQIDAKNIRDFLMINNTDSIYSFTVPVEYPKAGENPSACKVGVVNLLSKKTTWMQVPGDAVQHYIPRMEWIPGSSNRLIIQQLNRKQNSSKLMILQAANGQANTIFTETDKAWVDVKSSWDDGDITGWDWLNSGKSFLWLSEKDGWRHIYEINTTGGQEKLLTPGDYDVINLCRYNEAGRQLYFLASPGDATGQYLYKTDFSGTAATRVTPQAQRGTHKYEISPNGKVAGHSYESHLLSPTAEFVSLPEHNSISGKDFSGEAAKAAKRKDNTTYFQVTTADGVTLDAWMTKPRDFDSTKKYPVVFYVYGEPASFKITDSWGATNNFLYDGDMSRDGYIYMSIDNRGTPAPKGREWRKSIYRKVGLINARDQAMGAKEILKLPYVDKNRIAVWGWSGGGSMTLNLLFQYPEIYKTGIAIAAVANELTYDNIYQERYMGLPSENREDFVAGSPLTHAKNLQGKLLYIHGTGDDNVHYQNAEMLINELIKHKKIFQMMAYPNRTHGIYEGEGTTEHLSALYTQFLMMNCPPGAK
ncbi:S9 family peptidase [Chitinophaga barathri]|uniref:S9 family peptidase n=1 Tax=Chitinophaga barathri TaxID=1647451 RepID=A0A3N4MJ96_9BACT|nr:DPP IV N-terminal domain-containing protein [Chitinophaga barathri]RPD39749.1 S9 family peptidase [Chitinophaga barathri]